MLPTHVIDTWLMWILEAFEDSGFADIEKMELHRILYLSNCLAASFDIKSPSFSILKYKRGPFYPDEQWRIDRLNAIGFIDIVSLEHTIDQQGSWTNASYKLTASGRSTLSFASSTEYGNKSREFLQELVFSHARLGSQDRHNVALRDLNYVQPGDSEGVLVEFETRARNRALVTMDEFRDASPDLLSLPRRQTLELYLKYLQKLMKAV